ncbi:HGGxSTG domain-containing protein [Gilliamella sp. Nev5-1]|uniref:HGGxSTG domain-containing protein n=1 Tax=Gilliamella sp. Nev5-1 TaxID=3120251 RepID=UPI000AFB7702|nr:HGGxSTG domain-containing protein [Gilliamella apicola]
MAHLCGAKTRSGSPCKSKAMTNGRCRMHGGKSTGAPKGNKNNLKAGGIYSQFFTAEERQISAELELGSLDDELRLTKIRLMRALKAEAEQQERLDELELDSYSESPAIISGFPDNDEIVRVKQFKRRDYVSIIDRLTARIESLEMRRASLVQMSLDVERKQLENKELSEAIRNVSKDDPITEMEVVIVRAKNTNHND